MDLLERLRQHAATLPEVRLAVLFGSAARGEARSGSDVDLGILLDPDTREARNKALLELDRAAGEGVDAVFLSEAPPLLRFEIARDGVLIKEGDSGLWTDFKAKAMVDWWDWAPTARKINQVIIQNLRAKVGSGQI
jgi:predicted nucleotidyltransferase